MNTSLRRALGLLSLLCALPLLALAEDRFEAEPINYSRATPVNAISRLQEGIENGTVALDFDPQSGYLKPVLAALGIASESQVLVFSKTSFQNDYISPTTPRAIYFNDDSYVGTVQHGNVIEISTADPELGAVFYALRQEQTGRPEFVRQGHECLQCHASALTNNLPGHVVRSVYTDAKGFPLFGAGTHLTTQSSPFEERWGGWYVTGTHGAARHLGNTLARATENGAEFDPEAGANRTALDPRVDAGRYLTPHSDIVALMVLEHQTQMHNLITEAGFHTRMALRDQAVMDKILNRAPDILSESTQRRIASAGDKLVRHMLFVDEVELDDPIVGTSGYTERFAALGPFDGQGRSLREFDLESRLFKYPLSYLIYSPQFDGLPEEMKGYVYQRLWGILTGVENTPDYLHLTNAKSRAIREILLATKPGLPAYWTAGQG